MGLFLPAPFFAKTAPLFEAQGIEFLDQIEGVAGPDVRLKWGADLSQRLKREIDTAAAEDPTLDAAPWDREDDSVPPGIEDLRTFWRTRPEQWQALHEVSRLALLREMRPAHSAWNRNVARGAQASA